MSDLSPEAEELLKRAREAFSPDEARIAAVRAALAAQLGPSLPAKGPTGGAAAKAAAAGTATKLAAVGALVIASAVGARMLAGRTHGASPVASMSSVPPAPSSLSRKLPDAEPELSHGSPSISVDDLPSVRLDSTATGRAPLPARPSHEQDTVEESPSAVSPPEGSATGATDTALGGEVSLLRAAHLALDRGDAARALTLLDRYAQTYPNGTLEEEALATRALTLCALRQVGAAKDAARRLETIAPRSPQLARVRASCAGSENRSQ